MIRYSSTVSSGEWDHKNEKQPVRHIEWLRSYRPTIVGTASLSPVIYILCLYQYPTRNAVPNYVKLPHCPIHLPSCGWKRQPAIVNGTIISENYWRKIEICLCMYDLLIVTYRVYILYLTSSLGSFSIASCATVVFTVLHSQCPDRDASRQLCGLLQNPQMLVHHPPSSPRTEI